MIRMNRYLDTELILKSLEHSHRVNQEQAEGIIAKYGNELYNDTEKRFHKLIKKYNRKFERMQKRCQK